MISCLLTARKPAGWVHRTHGDAPHPNLPFRLLRGTAEESTIFHSDLPYKWT